MILCQEIIWTGKLTSTCCMRELHHKGEHDPMYDGKLSLKNQEKEKQNEPTKEELEAMKVEEKLCLISQKQKEIV